MKLGEWTIITKEKYEAALMSGLAQYIYKSGFYIPTQMSKESAYFYQKWNNAYFKSWQPYKKNRSEITHEAMAFDNDFYTVQPNNGSFSVECHPVTPNLCFITDDQNYRQAYYYRRHEIEQTATDPIEYEDREGKLICACGRNRTAPRVLLEAKEKLNVGTVDPANILADCNMSKLFKQGAFSIFNPDDYVSYVFQFADALKLTPNKTQRAFKSAWGCKSEDLEQHILNSKKECVELYFYNRDTGVSATLSVASGVFRGYGCNIPYIVQYKKDTTGPLQLYTHENGNFVQRFFSTTVWYELEIISHTSNVGVELVPVLSLEDLYLLWKEKAYADKRPAKDRDHYKFYQHKRDHSLEGETTINGSLYREGNKVHFIPYGMPKRAINTTASEEIGSKNATQ